MSSYFRKVLRFIDTLAKKLHIVCKASIFFCSDGIINKRKEKKKTSIVFQFECLCADALWVSLSCRALCISLTKLSLMISSHHSSRSRPVSRTDLQEGSWAKLLLKQDEASRMFSSSGEPSYKQTLVIY